MTYLSKFIQFLTVAILIFAMHSCASLTGYEDGKTLGKEGFEGLASINLSRTPDFDIDGDIGDTTGIDADIPGFFFPNLELGLRYGVTDRIDIVSRVNTNLNFFLGAKAQLLGDLNSKAALSAGVNLGNFALISPLWYVQVPVSFSYHPSDRFSWYLSPRFTYQFTSINTDVSASYLGANTGIFVGGRHKLALDLGYYNFGAEGASLGLLTVGIGGRFTFNESDSVGSSSNSSTSKAKKKKRK
jgi:hypothetical protein